MPLTLTTPPVSEPVPLLETKSFLRVTNSEQDDVITAMTKAARIYTEQLSGLQLMPATWTYTDHAFGRQRNQDFRLIYLDVYPINSITAFTYRDVNNTVQSLTASDYILKSSPRPYVYPSYPNRRWPSLVDDNYFYEDSLSITLDCGYADADSVPEELKLAIKLITKFWYENRSEITVVGKAATDKGPGDQFVPAPFSAREIIMSYSNSPNPA